MNGKGWKSYVIGLAPAVMLVTQAHAAPTSVGDFGLIDHQGAQHQLSRLGKNKAVVVITQANSCAENVDQLPRYKLLRTTWEKQGVQFLMLNSAQDDLNAIRKAAAAYDIDFPIMYDETQLVAENLQANKAGEIFVLDPNTKQVLFRGPLDRQAPPNDDGPNPATDRKIPSPLAETLTKAISGKGEFDKTVTVDVPKGCALNFPAKEALAKAIPDYSKDVAPILKDKCAHCHVQGGIGPFAMSSYDIVKGFSPMIREVLMTKRMPPAQVDPHVNHFQNANYISNQEIQTLVHWVDAGSPRGNAKADPLASVKAVEVEWQLGKPDMIVDVPAYEVPATGVIDYFNHVIDLPFNEDKYVRAIQFIPGDKRVLHHLLSYISSPDWDRSKPVSEENVRDFLEGYAPGKTDATQFPKETGVFIPKGHKLIMQMHYTTMGKPVTDKTRVALYFHKTPPKYKYLTYPISHGGRALNIPPGETDHKMNGSYVLPEDTMLHAMRPHMHYRGKAFRFTAVLPDQTRQVLMNVPNYNFAWQPTYRLDKPILLPAGTRIVTDGVYDNSQFNAGNPDPTVYAKGGPQSWDEMFIGYITYTLPSEGQAKQRQASR
jgi:peroxiredoxin